MATVFHTCDAAMLGPVVELLRRAYLEDGLPFDDAAARATVGRILARESRTRLWIIEQNRVLVGYLALELHDNQGFLWREASVTGLYLQPNYRNIGIGAKARMLARELAPSLGGYLRQLGAYREDMHLPLPAAQSLVPNPHSERAAA